MKKLSRITQTFTESVIREMTRISDSMNGINLSQGFPDFNAPVEIKRAAIRAINQNKNQYAITFGETELRDAIAIKAKRYNKMNCNPLTDITVTCGATEAMLASLTAIINPGDEIIIFEPFYEDVHAMEITTDGGYIIVGKGGSNGGIYLVKTDALGNVIWTKNYDSGFTNFANSVQQTEDGGYIIAGDIAWGGLNVYDILLLKTDSDGNVLWSKAIIGGLYFELSNAVQQTSDKGYIIAGATQYADLSSDVYLVKTDSAGDVMWNKTYGGRNGPHQEKGYSVQQMNDGGYMIGAKTTGFFDWNPALYLIRTDSLGDTLWTKIYGTGYNAWGYSAHQTNDGGFVFGGYINGVDHFDHDIYLVKTDAEGRSGCEIVPETIIGSIPTSNINYSIIAIPGGGIITRPIFQVSSLITQTDDSCYTFDQGESDYIVSMFPNPSPGYFVIQFNTVINDGNIYCWNTIGKKIFEERISNESEKEFHLENIASGIYFLKIKVENKENILKLLIQK